MRSLPSIERSATVAVVPARAKDEAAGRDAASSGRSKVIVRPAPSTSAETVLGLPSALLVTGWLENGPTAWEPSADCKRPAIWSDGGV